jgi:hypothetical protein
MQAEYPGAAWMPHRHFWEGRSGHHIRYVIVHGTASPDMATAAAIAHYFQTTTRETGTHYVVGKDGAVVQMVREADSAWGNGIVTAGHDPWWGTRGNPNLETVSVEHVKIGAHNEDAITPAQAAASFRLVAYLCAKYAIPARRADAAGGITGHYSIDPVNRKFCPGPYPWDGLFSYLEEVGAMGVPAGWKDDGTRLVAPNGIAVVHGFRAYVLAHTWEADDVPLYDECSTPGESMQVFARTKLVWTQAMGVQRARIGEELLAALTQLDRQAPARAAVAALRAALGAVRESKQ